jgi:Tol biopolymer transport system component
MNADGTRQTRLTDTPGEEAVPVWSPDGSRIAYTGDAGGYLAIFLMNPDGSGKVQISPEGMHVDYASWSADGRRLAVAIYVDGKSMLGVLDPGGGLVSLTTESDLDSEPAWSPDGSRIAFVSRTDEDGNKIAPELYLINPDGLERKRLTFTPGSESSPSWSPDGAQLAFISDRDGFNALYSMNVDGGSVRRVTGSSTSALQPDWGPAGASPVVEATMAPPGPRFNPGGDPWCVDTPDEVLAGDWQVVAPREIVVIGDAAEIGLRDNAGGGQTHSITARIIAPDETERTTSVSMIAGEWVTLVYPDDFGGEIDQRGAFTIIWESDGAFIACDGFIVAGGAS